MMQCIVTATTAFEFKNVSSSQVGCYYLSEGPRMCKFWGENMTAKEQDAHVFKQLEHFAHFGLEQLDQKGA